MFVTARNVRKGCHSNKITSGLVRGDAIIGLETLLMSDIVVMSRALEKSARAILSGTARVIGDEAERHSSTRQPHRHHRQVCPHQRQRTSSPLRRKPAARFGDHVSDARMAPLPNPYGKKLSGDGNVEQPAETAAARRKSSGSDRVFPCKTGRISSVRYMDYGACRSLSISRSASRTGVSNRDGQSVFWSRSIDC